MEMGRSFPFGRRSLCFFQGVIICPVGGKSSLASAPGSIAKGPPPEPISHKILSINFFQTRTRDGFGLVRKEKATTRVD